MSTATTWNSAGSTDANDVLNYSAGLPADAVVTLDATSVVNWIFTANMSVEQITIAAAYTGVVTMTGYTLTCSLGFSDDGTTGAHTYGTAITCNGNSSTLHVGSGLASITATSTEIFMNGTTSMALDIDKASTFKGLVIGTSAVVVNTGTSNTIYSSTGIPLTLNNNSTWTVNSGILSYRTTSSSALMSVGTGVTWNGTQNANLGGLGNNLILTIPEITYTGSGDIIVFPFSGSTGSQTITLTGNINLSTARLRVNDVYGVVSFVFNGNGYNVTCGTLAAGNGSGGVNTVTLNWGTGTYVVSSFDCVAIFAYNSGSTIESFSSSTWSCSGNWLFGSNHTINPGTSIVTITNTSTITSNGKSFYALIINAAARTITLAGTLTIATSGTLWVIAFTAFAGNQYIVFAGNGGITIQTNVSNRLRTAVGGSTIIWNTGTSRWTFPAYTAGDFGGTGPSRVIWRSSVAGTPYYIAAPATTINVSYMTFGDANNAAGGTIYALDGTSVDNGGNVNILFPSPLAQTGNSNSAISIPIGI